MHVIETYASAIEGQNRYTETFMIIPVTFEL